MENTLANQPGGKNNSDSSLNPLKIQRYYCPSCRKTMSVLPECIPRNRWYLWSVQQVILLLFVQGVSIMSKSIHPTALFRLMVLGPLASRTDVEHGEIKRIATELASKPYNIPDSKRTYVSKESILRWYYEWKRGGIEAL